MKVDYYTDANLDVDLKVLSVGESSQPEGQPAAHAWGEVLVTAQTHLYKNPVLHS